MMNNSNCLSKKSSFFVTGMLIVAAITLVLFVNRLPVRINLSASMPQGIYLLAATSTVSVGDFVMVCLDNVLAQFALQRGYLHAGNCINGEQPLLKQVAAQSNDKIELLANAVVINGKTLPHSATSRMDSFNRLLPAIPRSTYILKAHQLWLYGTESARSWDSRYFGAVDISHVVSVVKPLLIWSSRSTL
jgi:conjugative transfer signal peptidase TraF